MGGRTERFSWLLSYDKKKHLYTLRLRDSHTDQEFVVTYGFNRIIVSADVFGFSLGLQSTAVLKNFLVYRVRNQSGSTFKSQILLQPFTSSNGTIKFVGTPKALSPLKVTLQIGAEGFQTIAIDPAGRWVAYTDYNSTCRILILKFQRIDPATGKKIGTPKTLLGCTDIGTSLTGVYGLDAINLP